MLSVVEGSYIDICIRMWEHFNVKGANKIFVKYFTLGKQKVKIKKEKKLKNYYNSPDISAIT